MSGLSAAQRVAYDTHGYVAPLDVLPAAAAAEYAARLEPELTPSGGLADVRLRNKPHLLLAWVAELVRQPTILDAVEALLGPDLLVWRSVFFVKAPRDESYIGWHQDLAYWDLEDDRTVSAWIALTDSTLANGCVRVVPGSQHGALLPHRLERDRYNRLLRGQVADLDIADERIAPIELRAGQFSLHHGRLVHGSPGNPSERPRIGLAVRYIPSSVRTVGPRQSATLVRGRDYGHYQLEPPVPRDFDPVAVAAHRRALRQYGWQSVLQIARRPTPSQLALLARLALRPDLLRTVLPWRRSG